MVGGHAAGGAGRRVDSNDFPPLGPGHGGNTSAEGVIFESRDRDTVSFSFSLGFIYSIPNISC